eukprot:COSAG01_NODE_14237_length_1479_cov_1.105797_2_plen_161_part_00
MMCTGFAKAENSLSRSANLVTAVGRAVQLALHAIAFATNGTALILQNSSTALHGGCTFIVCAMLMHAFPHWSPGNPLHPCWHAQPTRPGPLLRGAGQVPLPWHVISALQYDVQLCPGTLGPAVGAAQDSFAAIDCALPLHSNRTRIRTPASVVPVKFFIQ